MGIIKAVTGATGGVLADQWLEMYLCDSIPHGILAQKGYRHVSQRSTNTKGDENVISDGSLIVVNEGQCALVLENGKVIGVYDRPGENVFHSERSASIFSGSGLKGLGRSIVERVGFGGDVCVHQYVVYINMKEQMNNPFSVQCYVLLTDRETGLEYSASAQVSGLFSFRITDPMTFYRVICGNYAGTISVSSVIPQLEAELSTAVMDALSRLTTDGIRPSSLPGATRELAEAMKAAMSEEWVARRGFAAVSVAVSELHLTPQDQKTIQTVQYNKMLRDPTMAAATLVGAQADAMRSAAQNPAGGRFTYIQSGIPRSADLSNLPTASISTDVPKTSVPTEIPKASVPTEVPGASVPTAVPPSSVPSGIPAAPAAPVAQPAQSRIWYCAHCGKFCSSRFCPDCGAQQKD